MAGYLIVMYERTIRGPYLQELAQLQAAMEDCIRKAHSEELRKASVMKDQNSFFKKKREESARIVAEATANINQILEPYERMLNRVMEIRADILRHG